MKKKSPHIADSLSHLLAAINQSYPNEAHRIWEIWGLVVGPELEKRTAPVEFKSGKLTIGVEGASWLAQIQFLAPQIISSLNERLGKDEVKTIRFKPAVVQKPEEPDPEGPLLREGPLDESELSMIERETSHIKDPLLANAVRKAREAALRRSAPRPHPKG